MKTRYGSLLSFITIHSPCVDNISIIHNGNNSRKGRLGKITGVTYSGNGYAKLVHILWYRTASHPEIEVSYSINSLNHYMVMDMEQMAALGYKMEFVLTSWFGAPRTFEHNKEPDNSTNPVKEYRIAVNGVPIAGDFSLHGAEMQAALLMAESKSKNTKIKIYACVREYKKSTQVTHYSL